MSAPRDQGPLNQMSFRRHLKSSRSHNEPFPPASLHHQYPHRAVTGWSYPETRMRSQPSPSVDLHSYPMPQSLSQEDLSYRAPSPHSNSPWPQVMPSEFEFYQTDRMLNNPPYVQSLCSDSQVYDIEPPPVHYDYSPGVEHTSYNVFDLNFASSLPLDHTQMHASHHHPHRLQPQPHHPHPHHHQSLDQQPTRASNRYISPSLYVQTTMPTSTAPSSPSSGHSSPTSGSFDYSDSLRGVSPASSSSSTPRISHHSHSPTRTVSATDPKRRFPCMQPGCGRRFTSQYTLKVHTEAHRPKPRVSFPCTMGCSEKFSRQHDRLRHEVAKHNKICEHSCSECGRFFSNAKTFGNHKCPVAKAGTRWISS